MTSSMAEVSYLRLPEIVEDAEQVDIFAFDSAFPFCSLNISSESDPISLNDHPIHHAGAFDPEIYNRIGGLTVGASGSGSFEEIFDHEIQVTSVMDLLQQRVEQSRSHLLEIGSFESVHNFEFDFGLIDRNREEIGGNSLELEAGEPLGLGTIFNLNTDLCHDDGEDDDIGDFIMSRVEGGNQFSGDSNLVRFASDSEEDEDDLLEDDLHCVDENPAHDGNDHMNIALCWDSLQLEDHLDENDEFEWEEVEVLPIAGPEEDQIEERDQQTSRNLEWEVLLGRNLDLENNEGFYLGGNDDYVYTAEYEMTIDENPSMGRPPASKLAIESLPSVTMTDEDVHNNNALCVVCKDEMGVGELVKQLPCSHRYHGDCIIPWLGIRNTCPICRCELPTDDPDYEQRKIQRAVRSQ